SGKRRAAAAGAEREDARADSIRRGGRLGGCSGLGGGRLRRRRRLAFRGRLAALARRGAGEVELLLAVLLEIGLVPAAAGQAERRRTDPAVQFGCRAGGADGGIGIGQLLQAIKTMAAAAAFKFVDGHGGFWTPDQDGAGLVAISGGPAPISTRAARPGRGAGTHRASSQRRRRVVAISAGGGGSRRPREGRRPGRRNPADRVSRPAPTRPRRATLEQ